MKRLHLVLVVGVLGIVPMVGARAQVGVSFWAGYAQASNSGSSTLDTNGPQLGAQLGLPLVPIAFRAEAVHWGTSFSTDRMSLLGSGVLQFRLPLLQLYAIAGYGRFAETDSTTVTGFHAGGGVRIGQGRLGLFGEVRRFDPVARTVTTLGVTF